jgi:hypothetical protein
LEGIKPAEGAPTAAGASGAHAPSHGESVTPTGRMGSPRGSVGSANRRHSRGQPLSPGPLTGSARRSSLGRKLDAARDFADNVARDVPEDDGTVCLRCIRLPRGGYYVKTCIGPIQVGLPPGEPSLQACVCLGAGVGGVGGLAEPAWTAKRVRALHASGRGARPLSVHVVLHVFACVHPFAAAVCAALLDARRHRPSKTSTAHYPPTSLTNLPQDASTPCVLSL